MDSETGLSVIGRNLCFSSAQGSLAEEIHAVWIGICLFTLTYPLLLVSFLPTIVHWLLFSVTLTSLPSSDLIPCLSLNS